MHPVVTGAGEPVEFASAAGSEADVAIFFADESELDLPEKALSPAPTKPTPTTTTRICSRRLVCARKPSERRTPRERCRRGRSFWASRCTPVHRDGFSRLRSFFPKKIQAVTPRGFELKIVWFLLAFSIQCL